MESSLHPSSHDIPSSNSNFFGDLYCEVLPLGSDLKSRADIHLVLFGPNDDAKTRLLFRKIPLMLGEQCSSREHAALLASELEINEAFAKTVKEYAAELGYEVYELNVSFTLLS